MRIAGLSCPAVPDRNSRAVARCTRLQKARHQRRSVFGYLFRWLDAIPSPAIVVDGDLSVVEFNDAAADLSDDDVLLATIRLSQDDTSIGELLHCVNARARQCGNSAACTQCGILSAVNNALSQQQGEQGVSRTITSIRQQQGGATTTAEFLTSARLFQHDDDLQVVLTFVDLAAWDRTDHGIKSTAASAHC
jgi:hypothetical protein